MQPFTYQPPAQRIVFGRGTLAALGEEARRLGAHRALLLTTPGRTRGVDAALAALGPRAAGHCDKAAMHSPVEATEAALALVAATRADLLVSLGGGSAIGLGKALALRTGLPQIALPTSYAGSEATPILGETAGGRKTTRRHPAILPKTVLYDIDLTLTLPVGLSIASGLNAMAHAVEALYAPRPDPVTALLARDGFRALHGALPRIAQNPADDEARGEALYGAWACGTVLGAVGMALHHKLCHVLGGSFGLPHAQTHAVILPHAVAYNARSAAEALAPLEALLATDDLAQSLFAFSARLGAPQSLAQLGLAEADLDRAALEATADPYWNPRPIDRPAIRRLLDNAFFGRPPQH